MFKNLKSLFVKEDEVKSIEKSTNTTEEQAMTEANISAETIATAEVESASEPIEFNENAADIDTKGEVSEKFMNILLGAINKNNQEGFDYIEFKQSLQSLSKMDMDEKTRIQSAFAMAQTMGATKARLLETAQYYLSILETESTKFNKAVGNQIAKQVDSKKENRKNIELSIANKEKQIEQLQKEIIQLKSDNENAKRAISVSETKVVKTKNDFLSTYELLKLKIHKDIQLIEKYTQ